MPTWWNERFLKLIAEAKGILRADRAFQDKFEFGTVELRDVAHEMATFVHEKSAGTVKNELSIKIASRYNPIIANWLQVEEAARGEISRTEILEQIVLALNEENKGLRSQLINYINNCSCTNRAEHPLELFDVDKYLKTI